MSLRDNRFWVLIIIFLLLLSFGNVQAQDWEENERNRGAEFLGAIIGEVLIGIPVAFIAGYVWVRTVPEYYKYIDPGSDMGQPAWIYLFCGTVGAPLGTVITGKIVHDDGSALGAFAGGIIGTGLAYLSVVQNFPAVVGLPTVLLGPQVFSVIGYNLFPHKSEFHSSVPKNFPELGLTVLPEKYDNKISPKIGAKVTVRF